jgi:hypothetical protein
MTGLTHVVAFAVSFVAIGLKGFQQKNITGHHIKATIVTSYLMSLTDILFIGLVAEYGWQLVFSSGTGAALGMVTAMVMHDRYMRK